MITDNITRAPSPYAPENGDTLVLSTNNGVNLRAEFLETKTFSPGGLVSPGGVFVTMPCSKGLWFDKAAALEAVEFFTRVAEIAK
jgi:hypothetical protein